MDNSIRLRVTDCVNSFIETFRENTDDFLYESEIHSILYSKLREKITERIELPIEIHTQLNEDRISTGIVRAEYPNALEYDIAIIHPLSQRRTTVGVDKNEAWWMQYLLGAIELKSWRLGDNIKKNFRVFQMI